MPRHIARWDLDKTYLRTEFDSLRDLVRTAFERPDQKRTNPGAATLLREMVRSNVSVHILSGSPEQMRRRLEDKLRLDGVNPVLVVNGGAPVTMPFPEATSAHYDNHQLGLFAGCFDTCPTTTMLVHRVRVLPAGCRP